MKKGKWICTDEGFSLYMCSRCGTVEFKKTKYCSDCGAKMFDINKKARNRKNEKRLSHTL